MYIEEESDLKHFGVPGMKWGVRKDRKANQTARTKRLKDGTATIRDRLIRDADLDGGRTDAGYRTSTSQRVVQGFVATFIAVHGAKKLYSIYKDDL